MRFILRKKHCVYIESIVQAIYQLHLLYSEMVQIVGHLCFKALRA